MKIRVIIIPALAIICASLILGCGGTDNEPANEQLTYLEKAKDYLSQVDSYTAVSNIEVFLKATSEESQIIYDLVTEVDLSSNNGLARLEMGMEGRPAVIEGKLYIYAYAMEDRFYYSWGRDYWYYIDLNEDWLFYIVPINLMIFPQIVVGLYGLPFSPDLSSYAPGALMSFTDYSAETSVFEEDEVTIRFAMEMGREYYLYSAIDEYQKSQALAYEDFSEEKKAMIERTADHEMQVTSVYIYPTIRKSDGMLLSLEVIYNRESRNIGGPIKQSAICHSEFTAYDETDFLVLPEETAFAEPRNPYGPWPKEY